MDICFYTQVFAVFSGLGPSIDTFFDTVRVNVEDEDLRKVRIGFLREIASYYKDLADELKGVVKASVISATKLSAKNLEMIWQHNLLQ